MRLRRSASRRRGPLTCAAVAGLLAGDAAAAQTPQSAIPREAVCAAQAESGVPAQRLAALQSGFSIPGWTNEEPARPPQEETLRELRQRGFRHIRLPIRPEDLSPAFAEPFAIERKFAGIDRAVAITSAPGWGMIESVNHH